MKKIFIGFLVFSFLFSGFSGINFIKAGNEIYPVELAVPDQPLVEGEGVDFYIIVNDKDLRSEISRFVFYLHGNDLAPMQIPYEGESHIKLSFKMPSLTYTEYLSTSLEVYTKTEEKYIIKVYKNAYYMVKYPMGLLPEKLSAQVQEEIAKKDFDFGSLYAVHKYVGEPVVVEINDWAPPWSQSPESIFQLRVDDKDHIKNSKAEEMIEERILNASDSVLQVFYRDVAPITDSEEIESSDEIISKILLVNASVFQVMDGGSIGDAQMPDTVLYDLKSSIDVFVKSERNDEANRAYSFVFSKSGEHVALNDYENEMEKFKKDIRDFAKSITMHKYQNTDFEDKEQSISVRSGIYPRPLPDYDLDSLSHSSIYNEILAGNEPGVEKLVKEKKEMEDRKFEISFRYNNEATIWNSGVVNTGTDKDTSFSISVNIDGKAFDKKGEEIVDVSDEELYKDVFLLYEIINPKSQIHFQEASVGENKFKVKVDDVLESQYLQSTGPILYTGPYLPTEYVSVVLVDGKENPISKRFIYKVHMKDATPQIETEKVVVEIDDVADSTFKFKINDEYHDKVKCTIKVPYEKYLANKIPVIKVSEYGQGEVATQIQEFECETNKWITIRVKPPKLSNFDMLTQLNGLNMWDLQRGTMEGFAVDLVGFGVEMRMDSLKKSKQALSGLYEKGYTSAKGVYGKVDKIEKTMRHLEGASDLAGNVQSAIKLTQIEKNADSHVSDVEKGLDGALRKDFWESTYDWGIGGINILQSTVGAVAMAPKAIPFVGKYAQKVTGTFSLVFNLMTNVWKGNLEYLSKEKKIDRAQEKSIPYPVMIGVTSEEGFRDADAQVISVLYTYLDNN